MAKLLFNAMDLTARGFALLAIQFHDLGAGQPPLRSVQNRGDHFQITYQFGSC